MTALGLRVRFRTGQFSELIRSARAGKLMMWSLGYNAVLRRPAVPHAVLQQGRDVCALQSRRDGPDLRTLSALPDGPERLSLLLHAERLAIAWMPYKYTSMQMRPHVTHPRLIGFDGRFSNDWFHLVTWTTARRQKWRGAKDGDRSR